MKKRKILLIFVLALAVLALGGCGREETEYWGLNAEITAVDSENEQLCVKDLGKAGVFGEGSYIDCSEASEQKRILYCNYETHELQDIAFSDLQVGDEILLNIDQSELEKIAKGEVIKAKKIQLGTQRLN